MSVVSEREIAIHSGMVDPRARLFLYCPGNLVNVG
jgi:hypothetical protein